MIAIIDYGVGNLRSVQKGFEYVGHEAKITGDPEEILSATHIVLPGVGAFVDAMESLERLELIPVIHKVIAQGKPFMGICLGMQLLFDRSYEGRLCEGLALIPGEIKRIPDNLGLKIPHMGWNILKYQDNEIFHGLERQPFVYFVHSYYLETPYHEYVIGTTEYGMEIQIAVRKDNLYGLQFHPEKSGDIGLKILKNFGGIKI